MARVRLSEIQAITCISTAPRFLHMISPELKYIFQYCTSSLLKACSPPPLTFLKENTLYQGQTMAVNMAFSFEKEFLT